ncbi:MAG: hypothetical protein LIP01_05890, partial [Tannerellaceae bacterium]|nr:hypothetical protein [Tannerellaceae bacterium]
DNKVYLGNTTLPGYMRHTTVIYEPGEIIRRGQLTGGVVITILFLVEYTFPALGAELTTIIRQRTDGLTKDLL